MIKIELITYNGKILTSEQRAQFAAAMSPYSDVAEAREDKYMSIPEEEWTIICLEYGHIITEVTYYDSY